MSDLKTIQPNFDLAWERGWEAISQEGSMTFQRLREEKGWTWEDVFALTDYALPPPRQELIEDFQGWPDFEELIALARIFEMTPGELLDRVLEEGDPVAQETNRVADELKDRLVGREKTLEAVKEVAELMGLEVKEAFVDYSIPGDPIVLSYEREDVKPTAVRIGDDSYHVTAHSGEEEKDAS